MSRSRLAGLYVVEAVAGRGGMGVVFRGRDTRSGERVAIKTLHADATQHLARFEREVSLIAAQQHEGIVRYVTHGYAAAPDVTRLEGSPLPLEAGDDSVRRWALPIFLSGAWTKRRPF
jgi:serine/threonine protein kinase